MGVWHVSSSRFSKSRGYPNVLETELYSYFLIVNDSSLLKTLVNQRTKHDSGWENYDFRQYKHYIVESHDFYINIIADKVTFSNVDGELAKQCFDVWENV